MLIAASVVLSLCPAECLIMNPMARRHQLGPYAMSPAEPRVLQTPPAKSDGCPRSPCGCGFRRSVFQAGYPPGGSCRSRDLGICILETFSGDSFWIGSEERDWAKAFAFAGFLVPSCRINCEIAGLSVNMARKTPVDKEVNCVDC